MELVLNPGILLWIYKQMNFLGKGCEFILVYLNEQVFPSPAGSKS